MFKNIIVYLLSFFLTLLFLEFFIAAAEIESKSPNIIDNELGRKRKPNAKFVNFTEAFSLGEFNDYGYLGPSYDTAKSDTVFRIALLGDSYVEGFSVFERHHFRTLLEQSLTEILNVKVEVMNFGHSGFRLGNMYVYDKLFVDRFNPDLRLYFLFESSLMSKTINYFPKIDVVDDSLTFNFSCLAKNRNLVLRNNFFAANFSMISMLKSASQLVKDKTYLFSMLFDKFYVDFTSHDKADSTQMINMTQDELFKTMLIFRNLEKANVIIVNRSIDGHSINLFNANIKEVILRPYFEDAFSDVQEANYWPVRNKFGHWNHQAHEVVAQALTKEICSYLIHNIEKFKRP